ncbi:hypothetical protein BCAR13_440037 [Paraburkholderia caribensis]|nr:hypothetical protein BCAR13_440037 [Paraburkholderia caribensis]
MEKGGVTSQAIAIAGFPVQIIVFASECADFMERDRGLCLFTDSCVSAVHRKSPELALN